jgi:oligopeptide transport system substrate-binding protein
VEALWTDRVRAQGEWLQSHWRDNLGVEFAWRVCDFEAYYAQISTETPAIFFGVWVADYPDPDNFLRVGNFWPRTRWHNATYARLVKDARRISDQDARMGMYQQADRILVEEAPIIPLVYRRGVVLVKPWITQFPVSPVSRWFWKDVILEPH